MAVEAMGMQIRIPQGDTGSVKFLYEKGEVMQEDRALFTVVSRSGAQVLRKVLSPDMNENAFWLPFAYEETAKLKPDNYEWSLRLVRGGAFDASGRITDAQHCHTAIAAGRLTVLEVAGGPK